ncbi:hypothetical protein [Snuella lapsa]|uniref:Ribbon-helix-helix protein CopG domain-containing protein n=1 Tax=Snuella lapsa TaxID=870481 RepID=A0ABP6XM18_9FLAO
MPKDICSHVNKALNEHSDKSPTMIRRAIRNYTEQLMSTNTKNSKKLSSFFDEELKKISKKQKPYTTYPTKSTNPVPRCRQFLTGGKTQQKPILMQS